MVKFMTRQQTYWALALVGFILSSILASLESVYLHDHLSLRTPLYMACVVWCYLALRAGKKDKKERQDEKDEGHGTS